MKVMSLVKYFKVVIFCLVVTPAYAQYSYTDLGNFNVYNNSLNNSGQIAGYTVTNNSAQAKIWSNGVFTNIGSTYPGDSPSNGYSYAFGINNLGQVVGEAYSGNGGYSRAARFESNTATYLGSPLEFSRALSINNLGQTAGFVNTNSGFIRATVWSNGVATELDSISNSSFAFDINNSGQIVGYSSQSDSATLWSNGNTVRLGGSGSQANAINDSGQIVGKVGSLATLWDNGVTSSLHTFEGLSSNANDINSAGLIVGEMYSDFDLVHFAALWNNDSVINLNSYLDHSALDQGWRLFKATGINDNGSIVGLAKNSFSGEFRSYYLSVTPVPEPQTYAIFIAGLCWLGFRARKNVN